MDCHISTDPEAMLLLMWGGRRSQGRAITRGQIVAWEPVNKGRSDASIVAKPQVSALRMGVRSSLFSALLGRKPWLGPALRSMIRNP